MNSIIRLHPVRLLDLQPYVRGYAPNNPLEPDAWARSESSKFDLGTLLFGLETIATPSRFSHTAKKEADPGISYRVKDLSVIVSLESERPLVISITASAYEERFLEVLLLEKARKAILDDKEFVYVAASPSQKVSQETSKELEHLGSVYAQGGSRRSLMADATGPGEPVLALLDVLGVRFAHSGAKTPLEIGLLCHLLFSSESRPDDKNKTLIKTCFTPVHASSESSAPHDGRTPLPVDGVVSFAPSNIAIEGSESSGTSQTTVQPPASSYDEQVEVIEGGAPGADEDKDDHPYKSLADAISGLTSGQQSGDSTTIGHGVEPQESGDIVGGASGTIPPDGLSDNVSPVSESFIPRSGPDSSNPFKFEALPDSRPTLDLETVPAYQDSEPSVEPVQGTQPLLAGLKEDLAPPVGGGEALGVDSLHVSQVEIAQNGTLASDAGARKAAAAAEPKLVLNEMASLMSKLEQQVSKASKRLASRAEDIENRLNKLNESLLEDAAQDDRNIEASLLVLSDNLAKEIEEASEELAEKIARVSLDGRSDIKELLEKSSSEIDDAEKSIQEELQSVCRTFRSDTDALVKDHKTSLEGLLKKSLVELDDLLEATLARLNASADHQVEKLNERFERFRQRMTEEASIVLVTVDRNVRSLGEEIDGSRQRASEKLKSTQTDFEQTILHAVRVAELTLSRSARTFLVEQFAPRLKERKEIATAMVVEMGKTFSENSGGQMRGQLIGLDASLASARQQLQTLAEECLTKIDSVGRDQQSDLEDLFKDTGGYIESNTAEVSTRLQKAEEQILESEAVCKKVAETFSLDADPVLTEERNSALSTVHAQRSQMKKDLEDAAELSCTKLEDLAQQAQIQAKAKRGEQIRVLRETSESGLNKIRESIQDAFNAIQAAREEHME
jgi:hypothetical protein